MTRNDLVRWLEAYGRAWETRDPAAAAALFAGDAEYHELPFQQPATGREAIRRYWKSATGSQRDIEFHSEILAVVNGTGIAHWSAEFTRTATGVRTRLDGIFLLEFDGHGLCTRLREWWHRTELPRGERPGRAG